MKAILENRLFLDSYRRLAEVKLNPRRHTACNAMAHSTAVAELALKLGRLNSCMADELLLLENLGYCHDVGKITGTARPERSLDVLGRCAVRDSNLLGLVKWHDVSLPWFRANERHQPPSDSAWRRLATEVNIKLLCMFMVADRVDSPGGWRSNMPTVWFLKEARRRNLVQGLQFDVPDHPSRTSVGVVFSVQQAGVQLLLIMRRPDGNLDLPYRAIHWDETPEDACCEEMALQTGIRGDWKVSRYLGHVQHSDHDDGDTYLHRINYYLVSRDNAVSHRELPKRTDGAIWMPLHEIRSLEQIDSALRPIMRFVLEHFGIA